MAIIEPNQNEVFAKAIDLPNSRDVVEGQHWFE